MATVCYCMYCLHSLRQIIIYKNRSFFVPLQPVSDPRWTCGAKRRWRCRTCVIVFMWVQHVWTRTLNLSTHLPCRLRLSTPDSEGKWLKPRWSWDHHSVWSVCPARCPTRRGRSGGFRSPGAKDAVERQQRSLANDEADGSGRSVRGRTSAGPQLGWAAT